jgi:hypothetical protein
MGTPRHLTPLLPAAVRAQQAVGEVRNRRIAATGNAQVSLPEELRP